MLRRRQNADVETQIGTNFDLDEDPTFSRYRLQSYLGAKSFHIHLLLWKMEKLPGQLNFLNMLGAESKYWI